MAGCYKTYTNNKQHTRIKRKENMEKYIPPRRKETKGQGGFQALHGWPRLLQLLEEAKR